MIRIADRDVLIVVDVQNDFCSGGALAVPDGEQVVPVINAVARHFRHVVLTQDWHPAGHFSFASRHPGKRPFQSIAASSGKQTLWPDHCVQDSIGAAFHPDLAPGRVDLILRKGAYPDIDSYSAFLENDRRTRTGLAGYLREREASRLFLAGLAFDYCVGFSALDAVADGFATFVIEDACRSIDLGGSAARMRDSLAGASVGLIASNAFT